MYADKYRVKIFIRIWLCIAFLRITSWQVASLPVYPPQTRINDRKPYSYRSEMEKAPKGLILFLHE